MAQNNKNTKQGLLHFGSIAVAIVVIAAFFVLDLNETEDSTVSHINTEGINMDIPEPESEIEQNKLAAIKAEIRRAEAEKEQAYSQTSSFNLMENLSVPKEQEERQKLMNAEVTTTNITLEEIQREDSQEIKLPITETPKVTEPEPQPHRKAASTGGTKKTKKIAKTTETDDYEKRVEREKELARKKAYASLGMEYPEQKKEEVKETPKKEDVKKETPKNNNPFISLNESKSSTKSGIRVVTHGEQKDITTSSQVRLRLLDPMTIDGTTIPKNTEIIGKASFSENRVQIKIENINYKNNIYPFQGTIYDKDGFEGIYIADNIVNDVSKESASNTINSASYQSGLTGLISKGTNAIVTATKNAVTGAVRETKVTLPANYRLILKTKNQ